MMGEKDIRMPMKMKIHQVKVQGMEAAKGYSREAPKSNTAVYQKVVRSCLIL